ncbi:HEPN domain-containing protein [Pseudomonas protegens]|uniref:HEPN domain-containing protein n=1 Tax=Pseudomonas protegens TaxID=380021 RepID=UPI001B3237AB|nr:HEPN domain-containing protein [Pseudomonas protegens]
MMDIDRALHSEGVKAYQRPLHVQKKFWEAFGWGGRISPPDSLADQAGFAGDTLMAKANRWYEEVLGQRLKIHFSLGDVPAKIGNAIWRVRLCEWSGTVNFFAHRNLGNRGNQKGTTKERPSLNILTAVDNLTQGMIDRLSDEEIISHHRYHIFALHALEWRNNLPATNLFEAAKDDYSSSTEDVLSDRYSQSRWASQQCVEKTLKGFLELAEEKYPKGAQGHDLMTLRELLHSKLNISINPNLIHSAHCATGARYRDEPSSQEQAFAANVAALGIYSTLKGSPKAAELLNNLRLRSK